VNCCSRPGRSSLSSDSLRRVALLMEQYADVPMDFADATLVALAEDARTGNILTLDRRGFSAYRWLKTRTFTILP
jgi:predicted nucleic acid-binding protein